MGLSRRFLNLIVRNGNPGIRSLRCIDLKRLQLFHPTTPAAAADGGRSNSGAPQDATSHTPDPEAASGSQSNKREVVVAPGLTIERFRLPRPSYSFEACRAQAEDYTWSIGCFPLAGREVLCTDQCGRAFLFDPGTRCMETVPTLHTPKLMPASLFAPSPDGGGSLFLMERVPRPEERRHSMRGQPSDEFEAIAYRNTGMTAPSKLWHCQLLPPPPYVYDPMYWNLQSSISSYAVVGEGSHICISVEGIGAYCLDTVNHTWSKAGGWTLPFHGKVEYVPELKLWFGLSADAQHLVAADLSAMDSQPQVVGTWKELHLPEQWKERMQSQVVNLGSGRFCIARFMLTPTKDGLFGQEFVVLTGVEVIPRFHNDNETGGNGKLQLKMIPHKSRCHMSVDNTRIEEMF